MQFYCQNTIRPKKYTKLCLRVENGVGRYNISFVHVLYKNLTCYNTVPVYQKQMSIICSFFSHLFDGLSSTNGQSYDIHLIIQIPKYNLMGKNNIYYISRIYITSTI